MIGENRTSPLVSGELPGEKQKSGFVCVGCIYACESYEVGE